MSRCWGGGGSDLEIVAARKWTPLGQRIISQLHIEACGHLTVEVWCSAVSFCQYAITKGSHIGGARSPWTTQFCTMGPQCVTCVMSPFWVPKCFDIASTFVGNLCMRGYDTAQCECLSYYAQGGKGAAYSICLGHLNSFLSYYVQNCAFNLCINIPSLPINV
jgi:hypothetical protein